VKDSLTTARISFFSSVAAEVEPFVKKYQSSLPVAMYMYDDLGNVMRSLMTRFIKRSQLDNAKQIYDLVKIDISASKCTYKEVDIGFAAKKELLNCRGVSDSQKANSACNVCSF
jgi:hypothetical protein